MNKYQTISKTIIVNSIILLLIESYLAIGLFMYLFLECSY